ncbi:signal transduction histidine kinase/DNA-binding NarL/FixJ family response regulator [Sphingobium sp. B2D3A]|uniref:hybrid sensor histidine kinase/response regulator n=1 Tax=unclassified Sphingobium TaxID=2611147 RepID=UPI0022257306|nr:MULTISPECIES: ATP-binding protein [unclassified Sphingobium]MCW2339154.1 signal transduction histidine kinase/DNA-binding NarL/FixJ family response regulator [Sphingobium sp. B2D3A]MCW2386902.1 signal transduction histidine kinase/DNA-binding NarL/FixJ family response regulator [Sphingobium sp. B2D3D]
MPWFSPWSFRRGLIATVLSSCMVALLLSCAGLAAWQYHVQSAANAERQSELGEVVAATLGAPLVFNDVKAIQETLASMATIKTIRSIEVYDEQQRRIAVRGQPPQTGNQDKPAALVGSKADQAGLQVVTPIMVAGDTVGWLKLSTQTETLTEMMLRTLGIASAFGCIAFLVAWLIARRMLTLLFFPMDRMVEAMERIRQTADYSARMPQSIGDELGRIVKAFNGMLTEIERREGALAATLTDLQAARDQAQAANVAKSEFLASMSHELRTPLNAIIAYAELVKEELAALDDKENLADVTVIHRSALQLLTLINEVLDFAKIEAGGMTLDLEMIDLGDIMRDVLATLEPIASRRNNSVALQINVPPTPMRIDPLKIRQCLLNLGGNACKFTDEGHIVLSASLKEEGAATLLILSVADTGIGIDAEQIDGLFEPFVQGSTASYRAGGTGLGLSITLRFVELMGGTISVSSEKGLGTIFTVAIPIEREAQSGVLSIEEMTPAGVKPDHIIAIDDDPACLAILDRWLSPAGYDLRLASGGEAGLQMVRETSPCAILLDLVMPGTDGRAVLRQLSEDEALAAIPCFIISVHDMEASSFALGAAAYLPKPLQRDRLLSLLGLYTEARQLAARVCVSGFDAAMSAKLERSLKQAGFTLCMADDRPDLAVVDLAQIASDHVHRGTRTRRASAVLVMGERRPEDDVLRRLGGDAFLDPRSFAPEALVKAAVKLVKDQREALARVRTDQPFDDGMHHVLLD